MFPVTMNSLIMITISVIFLLAVPINSFNLSPIPNIIYQEPQLKTFLPKVQSSYFGFTLSLRTNSIIVGAPRAQSSLVSQRNINETGAIYKCKIDTKVCEPYIFDANGNISEEPNSYTYNSEKKDYQWLGMSMDGNGLDTDRLVVCSPRTLADITNHYLIHGLCYWTPNTTESRPLNVQKIAPLRLRDKQQTIMHNDRYYYYMYGEQGISVHITENNEEIIIGAPGVYTWKGTVIRYRARSQDDFGGLSRRDQQRRLITTKRDVIEYTSEVPNPALWNQPDDSYFGYAVSSGYFGGKQSAKLLYLASAPQANSQQGEVYLFDIVDHYTTEKTIKIFYNFTSEQMGSYYGYALITDDFNGDGFTDVAVAAPLYSSGASYENGAVYIYVNQGQINNDRWNPSFALNAMLTSDYNSNGRFGTAISKIGDINQDGFNDLAIGAPYEDNGAVYIYLGGINGIVPKPSQKLSAPSNTNANQFMPHMFGHGLSKGADIDQNNYLDFAVGAPNVDAVYVYKAYPVVKVIANVIPQTQELKTTDTSFGMKVCWVLESKFDIQTKSTVNISLKADPQFGRAQFDNKNNQFDFTVPIGMTELCRNVTVAVKFSIADIFKPIDIEMHYKVLNTLANYSDNFIADETSSITEFCTSCVAVNPVDPKFIKNKVVFSTGCKSEKCIADLSLSGNVLQESLPYILGSSKTLSLDYKIQNHGETAYLAQIRIEIPNNVAFSKIPSSCIMDNDDLLCDINNGSPLFNDNSATLKVTLDTTKLDGENLVIKAQVFSTGEELNNDDNFVETTIPLAEFSDVEISGKSSKTLLSLAEGLRMENITHIFEIRNNGPSTIKYLDIIFAVPISYLDPWTFSRLNVVNFEEIVIKGQYNNQQLEVEWTQNNTILIQNPIESSTNPILTVDNLNMNGMDFEQTKLGMDYNHAGSMQIDMNPMNFDDSIGRRRRRRRDAETTGRVTYRNYNRYTQRIVDDNHHVFRRSTFSVNDVILANLPINRTIMFDCDMTVEGQCVEARISVHNFRVGNVPIVVALNFTVDLNKVDQILTEKQDIFVIRTSASINKMNDDKGDSINVIQTHPYTIISKYQPSSTPIWVYVVSVLAGLLTLILMTYGLYKAGFFKRAIKEEQEKLTRQSLALANQEHQETDNE